MEDRVVYHGSQQIVKQPEIRTARYSKDFGTGFYCTFFREQAIRWATRYPATGFVNEFFYREESGLNIRIFDSMTEEWLDFIVSCRAGGEHEFDIVAGPMADDTIFNYVQDFVDGAISREAFWALAKFKKPTHQICFHTELALKTLRFKGYGQYEKE